MQTTAERVVQDSVAGIRIDEKEVGFYRREGYLYLPGLLAPSAAREARREALEIVSVEHGVETTQGRGRDGAALKLVQSNQYLLGSVLDGVINSEHLRQIATSLLGGEACVYLPFTAVKSGGGGGRFSFHQDNQYTRFTDGLGGINIWFALTDMTPENGCLQMCPRSHLRGTLEAESEADGHRRMKVDPKEFLPMRMRAGDAVAFSRLTVHGSGENGTDAPRVGYAVQFYRADVEAIWENQPPRRLKDHPRWSVGPVEQLTAPDAGGKDGH